MSEIKVTKEIKGVSVVYVCRRCGTIYSEPIEQIMNHWGGAIAKAVNPPIFHNCAGADNPMVLGLADAREVLITYKSNKYRVREKLSSDNGLYYAAGAIVEAEEEDPPSKFLLLGGEKVLKIFLEKVED